MAEILMLMYKFQKDRGIKKQCVTNTQFLYDCLKHSGITDVKARPCLVVTFREGLFDTIPHVVVGNSINDLAIDPSYEVTSLTKKHYYFTIKEYMEATQDLLLSDSYKKNVISHFIGLSNCADGINNGGIVVFEEYYNEQADFIKKNTRGRAGPPRDNGM